MKEGGSFFAGCEQYLISDREGVHLPVILLLSFLLVVNLVLISDREGVHLPVIFVALRILFVVLISDREGVHLFVSLRVRLVVLISDREGVHLPDFLLLSSPASYLPVIFTSLTCGFSELFARWLFSTLAGGESTCLVAITDCCS